MHLDACEKVLDLVGPREFRLVGTAAARAQGVALPVGDVDLLMAGRDDVDRFAAALGGHPVWLAEAGQYYATAVVDGVTVEASTVETPDDTATHECAGRGPWEHHVPVPLGRHVVPAVRLELRLVSELVRNRPDRALPILDHLRAHGADWELVRRAVHDRGVNPGRLLDGLWRS